MIMVEKEELIKSVYIYCDRFSSEETFKTAIKSIPGIQLEILKRNDVVQVYFIDDNTSESFAWALFYKTICIDKKFNITQFEDAGERNTNKLIDLPDKYRDSFMRSLNSYFSKPKHFTKIKGKTISKYKQKKDLIFDIFILSDGVKALNLINDRVQNNSCTADKPIPKYILNRFKTVEEVPYHRILIEIEDIDKAIDNLSDFYYHTLSVWFFPERKERNKQGYEDANSLKNGNDAKYQKSLRNKNESLEALFSSIIYIQ